MDYKQTKLESPELTDLQLPNYDILHDVMSSCISEIVKKREDQILKTLEDNGYKFQNRVELEEFARTRCQLLTFQDSLKRILVVDGKQTCEWWETSRFENNGNKITCIIGEHPSFTPNGN